MTAEPGIERVREILFGEILAELEHRLAKLESYITSRSTDIQHDARQRADVLEAHLKKEVDAMEARIARVERENRERALAEAKTFFDELAQLRGQLRAAAAREDDEDEAGLERGTEHAASDAH
jgi:hypothetical protein